jgi:hypothetical protein
MTEINECGMSEISIMHWSLVGVGWMAAGCIGLYQTWVPMNPMNNLWGLMSP